MSVRVPPEWEPHERTIVCWPARDDLWGGLRDRAVEDHAEIVAAVARFEPVTVVAHPRHAEEARARCDAALGGGAHAVEVVEIPIDDSWARDSGPLHARRPDGGLVVSGITFDGWGRKFEPFDQDALLGRRWAERSGLPFVDVQARTPDGEVRPFVLEGGSVTVDGAGTVVTTEQCLLHPNRNPELTRAGIEAALGAALGATTVVWLPFGLVLDHDTDGHVDNVAAFVGPGVVLAQGCDDPSEPDHDRLAIDVRCLRGAPDARGEPIEVVEVPVLPFTEVAGTRVAVPYLNLYLCNGGALVPVCGHPADDEVLALIGEQLPGRQVVAVPGAVLAHGGGGPHCITQQVPAATAPGGPPTGAVTPGREGGGA
ncbi:agmatine deiminase family protein [Dermatobacter hominis]|uniref:agmatine deiminase family protein n=1 Tax=Dermatobacter hominis TaxID=2884263 RepID=UPI001D0F759F|nr:agmatine deiminase family protein [Dermatobacter hominis]UDY37365.1 agmatine deiminase family protein [Dermatobacter hominis]